MSCSPGTTSRGRRSADGKSRPSPRPADERVSARSYASAVVVFIVIRACVARPGHGTGTGPDAGHAGQVGRPQMQVRFAAELRLFLKPAHRGGTVRVACDGASSLGHVVQSLGVPLTEVGHLVVNGGPVTPRYRPRGGDVAEAGPVVRPQPVPTARFILDVHLGALARRLRLAGVDAAYPGDLDDNALIEQANAGRRVLFDPRPRPAAPAHPVAGRLRVWRTPRRPAGRCAGPVRPAAGAVDPVHRLQRPPVPGAQGRGGAAAAARHTADLPGILTLPSLRPGVLARCPQRTTPGPHRSSTTRRPHRRPRPQQITGAAEERGSVFLRASWP